MSLRFKCDQCGKDSWAMTSEFYPTCDICAHKILAQRASEPHTDDEDAIPSVEA